MKASDLLIKALENEGVEYIFGLPGEENLDLLESIRSSSIKFILTRHEQGAGFMAATYGRLTGKPGVCLATLGPGATNMMTPTAYAQLGAMPMMIITGQKPIKTSKQGKFQIVDIVEMMKPLTKFTKQITHSAHIPAIVREAFRVASEERPGAVHIELPEDIAQEMPEVSSVFKVVPTQFPTATSSAIQDAAAVIRNAKHPLLLIGAGANRKNTCDALKEMVESLEIPFFNTQMGKGVIDERNALYLGTAALSDDDFLHEAINYADVIINVGHDIIEKPPFFMRENEKRIVIHINFFAAEIDEVYFPQLNVIGDIGSSIEGLTKALANDKPIWDISFFKEVKANMNKRLTTYEAEERFPILPQRLVKILQDILPEDGMITLDNGIYKLWFARNYKAYTHQSLLLDNALATMGAGLPSAMMAKELFGDRMVISVNGDGGFMMNAQELETAIRMELDLIVIILNDHGYGMIEWKQEGEGLPKYGLSYGNPDFVAFAESFGATAYRPETTQQLQQMLKTAMDKKGVQLFDLAVDYSLNHEILNQKIKAYSNTKKRKER